MTSDPYASALVDAALAYAALGWLIVPCHTPVRGRNGAFECSCELGPKCPSTGKHPRTKNGLKDASSNPEQIREWWSIWPRANIAVIGGRSSNLVVLDFDFPKGGEDEHSRLEKEFGDFPLSATARTGNGVHYYFQHVGGREIPSGAQVVGSGVDVRADGGYVIAPPSVHYSGRQYEWIRPPSTPADIPPMPPWLNEVFDKRAAERQPKPRPTPDRHREVSFEEKIRRCQLYIDRIPGVAEGGRNDAAAKNACPVGKDFDLEEDEFWPILCSWNDRNSPPLSDRELRRTLASANRSRKYPVGCRLYEDSEEWLAQQALREQHKQLQDETYFEELEKVAAEIEAAAGPSPVSQVGTSRRTPPQDLRPTGAGGPPSGAPSGAPEEGGDLRHTPLMDLRTSSSLKGPDGLPRSELGNSQRILRDHGSDIKYSPILKRWFLWTGTKWCEDDKGEIIGELVSKTARSMHALVTKAYAQGDNEGKDWIAWIKSSETKHNMESSLALAGSTRAVSVGLQDFDKDDFLINTQSGIVDIRTMGVSRPDRNRLMAKVTSTGYDPSADCPTWKAFLHRIFNGDLELIQFYKRASGYSLTGSTREQCLFFCFGGGSNGKSTALTAMQEVAHEYARSTDFDSFLEKQNDKISNDLARLQGARFVAATEPDRRKRLDEATIKRVTGQDTITARFLFKEYFEFKFRAKIWLAANHKPQITGTDEGIWRRIRLIPFTEHIRDDEKDPDLPDKLRREYPGILAWMIEGAHEWYSHGLGMPESVKKATATYRSEMDKLALFISECCVLDADLSQQSSAVYEVYKKWCVDNGERYLSHRKFTQSLAERGIETKKTMKYKVYVGLALQADDDDRPSGMPPSDRWSGYDND